MAGLSWARRLAALASLADEKRLQLFETVAAAPDALGRDDVARSAGIPRSTASFHLDRLVQDGLLAVEFRKPPGRSGPGSGRPAKMYRPVAGEIAVSVPDRRYDLAGDLLAVAVERSQETGEDVREALLETSYGRGRDLGAAAGSLEGFLAGTGYRPQSDGQGGFVLPNCPFHHLSQGHRDVVCSMNGAFLRGAAEGCGAADSRVVGSDVPGQCCAAVVAVPRTRQGHDGGTPEG